MFTLKIAPTGPILLVLSALMLVGLWVCNAQPISTAGGRVEIDIGNHDHDIFRVNELFLADDLAASVPSIEDTIKYIKQKIDLFHVNCFCEQRWIKKVVSINIAEDRLLFEQLQGGSQMERYYRERYEINFSLVDGIDVVDSMSWRPEYVTWERRECCIIKITCKSICIKTETKEDRDVLRTATIIPLSPSDEAARVAKALIHLRDIVRKPRMEELFD